MFDYLWGLVIYCAYMAAPRPTTIFPCDEERAKVPAQNIPQCSLGVLTPELELVLAADTHVLILVPEALGDPVREAMARDDLPMFMEPTRRLVNALKTSRLK